MKIDSTKHGNEVALELYSYTLKEIQDLDELMIVLIGFTSNTIMAICRKERDKKVINMTVDYFIQQVRYQLKHQLRELNT